MIYWFTGQPCAGKTTLAQELRKHLTPHIKMVDGDDLRDLIQNKDYSIKGRVYNVDIAQKIAHYEHNQGANVIVSLVSPYLDQREEFKKLLGNDIIEIYVHTSEARERDHFHVEGYQPPTNNFISIDTTEDTIEESMKKILEQI
jgi:adenylylsulfate kinase